MKKIIALIIVAGFFASACSQYTCPTYAKKEAPKKAVASKRI